MKFVLRHLRHRGLISQNKILATEQTYLWRPTTIGIFIILRKPNYLTSFIVIFKFNHPGQIDSYASFDILKKTYEQLNGFLIARINC